jgi:outer membrane receptor for Fe3+-dicitrate
MLAIRYALRSLVRHPGFSAVIVVTSALHDYQQVGARSRLLLRLENIFDERYAASSLFAARAGNVPGQPRTFSIQLTLSTGRGAQRP